MFSRPKGIKLPEFGLVAHLLFLLGMNLFRSVIWSCTLTALMAEWGGRKTKNHVSDRALLSVSAHLCLQQHAQTSAETTSGPDDAESDELCHCVTHCSGFLRLSHSQLLSHCSLKKTHMRRHKLVCPSRTKEEVLINVLRRAESKSECRWEERPSGWTRWT